MMESVGLEACMGQEAEKLQRKIPRWLMPALGYALSAASLIWVFHGFNLRQTLANLASLDWRYVSVAVIVDLTVYLSHGWRWNILLRPVARLPFWRSVQAIYIGLYANEILPLRTGEVIRAYLLAHWNEIPISLALSSVAIERIIDGVWLVIALLITTQLVALPAYLVDGTRVMGIGLAALLGVLIFISVHKQKAHAVASERRWTRWLRHVIEGIHAMGNWRTMLATAGASLVYLALQIVPWWALMEGYGLDLSIWAAAVVYIVVRLGTVIPNAPGNAGVTQLFCALGLELFHVPQPTAKEFSFIVFGVLTLPLLIGGFIAVALTGLKIGDIHTRAHRSARSAVEITSD
jgi:glycosyltransferase 2 family protein